MLPPRALGLLDRADADDDYAVLPFCSVTAYKALSNPSASLTKPWLSLTNGSPAIAEGSWTCPEKMRRRNSAALSAPAGSAPLSAGTHRAKTARQAHKYRLREGFVVIFLSQTD